MKLGKFVMTMLCAAAWPVLAQVTTVDATKKMADDAQVTLEGKILRQAGADDDEFVFEDATGTITVDIDDDLRRATPVTPGMRVKITGEVDKEFLGRKVEVKRMELLPEAEITLPAIQLPKPDEAGGKPLMQALKERQSKRQFAEKAIPEDVLSSMLWAGFGVNRPDGRRTAPTAMNNQDITIYALTEKGAFRYDAAANTLEPRSDTDARADVVTQGFAKKAPLVLLYAQTVKSKEANPRQDIFGGMHVGSISQNVSLYCASEDLAGVVVASFNAGAAEKALKLPGDQRILLAHVIGYPQ